MPHLRELVKLHEGKPFAIVGVNTGDEPEDYREGLDDFDVSWISAYQGEETPIARQYRVQGYPTYYLIDAEGRIVSKGHSSQAFSEPIRRLIRELEQAEAKTVEAGG